MAERQMLNVSVRRWVPGVGPAMSVGPGGMCSSSVPGLGLVNAQLS